MCYWKTILAAGETYNAVAVVFEKREKSNLTLIRNPSQETLHHVQDLRNLNSQDYYFPIV